MQSHAHCSSNILGLQDKATQQDDEPDRTLTMMKGLPYSSKTAVMLPALPLQPLSAQTVCDVRLLSISSVEV